VSAKTLQIAISVVIPTRDRGAAVYRSVKSVLSSSRHDLEVIVVDDGSTDHTMSHLLTIDDSRLRFHHLESAGNANRARNAGARLARGELIAFLDSDDCFGPNRVDRLIDFFGRRPDIDCLVDGYIEINRGATRIHSMPRLNPSPPQLRYMLVAHLIPLTNSAITVRGPAFEAVGGYDENLRRHQDRELLLRLTKRHSLWLGDVTDVEKHRLGRSLSHEHDGYIAGMDALAARCPDYSLPQNDDVFRYLVVRGIIKAITTGHWAAGFRELRQWRKAQHLPKGYFKCLGAYWIGRSQRSRAKKDHAAVPGSS